MFTSFFPTTQAILWKQVDSPALPVGLLWGLRPEGLLGEVLGLQPSCRGPWDRPKLWLALGAGLVSYHLFAFPTCYYPS